MLNAEPLGERYAAECVSRLELQVAAGDVDGFHEAGNLARAAAQIDVAHCVRTGESKVTAPEYLPEQSGTYLNDLSRCIIVTCRALKRLLDL